MNQVPSQKEKKAIAMVHARAAARVNLSGLIVNKSPDEIRNLLEAMIEALEDLTMDINS
jgi:hypothetical protein